MNARLDIELELDELFFVHYYKCFDGANFDLALRPSERCFVDEVPRQSKKDWIDDLLKARHWRSFSREVHQLATLPKGYRPVVWMNEHVEKALP